MKQNPYSTTLGSIGGLGMLAAAVTYFIGAGMGVDGVTVVVFSQWLGQFAGVAFVGFLLYEAFEWLGTERRRVDAETRKRASSTV